MFCSPEARPARQVRAIYGMWSEGPTQPNLRTDRQPLNTTKPRERKKCGWWGINATVSAQASMVSKPLTFEAVPLIEKKMDMTLDEIIKMSKKTTQPKGKKPQRQPNKNQRVLTDNVSKRNAKVQGFMDSRSFIRQGVLAQRRTNFRGNQFQATKEYARRAVAMPNHSRVLSSIKPRLAATPFLRKATVSSYDGKDNVSSKHRPQTMDALFADMKEQRMRAMSQQAIRGTSRPLAQKRQPQQHQRASGRPAPFNNGRRTGVFYK